MFDVITFGSATRDVFLRSKAMELHREHGLVEACFVFGAKLNVEEIILETGGGGTNNAVTFSRMAKMRTAVVTKIGADSPGEDIIKALKKERVATEFVQHDSRGTTGYSSIILSGNAERTILTYRGVSSEIDAARIPWQKLKAKLFHVSSLGGDLALFDRIIVHARRLGAKVYWNPGLNELTRGVSVLAPFLKRIDLVSLNRDEAALLTNKKTADLRGIIKSMRRLAADSIITDGEKGAYAVSSKSV
ncbi:MAG: carbohydrate kinase family protein, partial [Desulfobacteraceae bacterium]